MEIWTLFWREVISVIQRAVSMAELGLERRDSSFRHLGGSKIAELCSCQLLQRQILLIGPPAPPETGISSMLHKNLYKPSLQTGLGKKQQENRLSILVPFHL